MTNIVKSVSIGGQVYPFAGGGSEGQEVVYLTQAEYDALPASKLTDGKIYKVKTTGVVPGGSTDASDVEYDNTTSGMTATNVQDAIDEIVQSIPTPGLGTPTLIVSDSTTNGTVADLSGYNWFIVCAEYNNSYVFTEFTYKDFLLGGRSYYYDRSNTAKYPAGSITGTSLDNMTVRGASSGYVTLSVYGVS